MNLPSSTATPTSTSSPSSDAPPREICSDCGSKDSWVIHTVRLRCLVKAFCTNCLLRNHPQSFCPTCFVIFDSSPPHHPSRRINCTNCSSNTHTQCIGDEEASTYLCPPCRNPDSFSFFRPIIGADGTRIVNQSLSEAFFCAAKIAYSSMSKAAQSAKTECERRGREAALARKRAREQLEGVVTLDGKEKARFSGGGGAKVVKEASVVEQKPKLLTPVTAASNGGNAAKEKETESQVKNNGGAAKQGLQLAKVKQEGGVDGSK